MRNSIAEKVINESGGIAGTSTLNAAGIANYEISRLCTAGFIKRIRHGYYSLREVPEDIILSAVLPEGIVCMQSALYHYGYCNCPDVWNIAVPRSLSRSKLHMECIRYKPYFVRSDFWELGKTSELFDNTHLAVYDRERTICDLFRYRGKTDPNLFATSLYMYASDCRSDFEKLKEYSEIMNIEKRVREAFEIVLSSRPFYLKSNDA